MSARRLYILDFDRTIFDTRRFFKDMVAALERSHRLDIQAFTNTFDTFVTPESGGYDPHSHHEHLLGLSASELDAAVIQELGDRDYAYPDAANWLRKHVNIPDEDIIIVTMGRPRYQELKFRHVPMVQNLPKVVVSTNKGAVIRQHLEGTKGEYDLSFLDQPYREIILIDDSAETFTALGETDRISGIRIARPGEKYSEITTPPHVRHITSFGELS